jgi:hypothetical protein
MNTKIFTLITKNLNEAFKLPKYDAVRDSINPTTVLMTLPWTPARLAKFKEALELELQLVSDFKGTIHEIVADLDCRYLHRFFGEMWKPRTETFSYTGWQLAEEINKLNPERVLDVGCGYHPFKGRIHNIVGIDPFNSAADYMVDILDYRVAPGTYDVVMALGSINFNSQDEIEARFGHCVNLLKQGGKFYVRANPGLTHKTGPYVDVFPWTFEVVNEIAEKFNLKLETFKKDNNDRLYFVYQKL